MQPIVYEFTFELDQAGHPTWALLRSQANGRDLPAVREDFGPFCDRLDLARWLLRQVSHTLPLRLR